jgi:hypothetical protein
MSVVVIGTRGRRYLYRGNRSFGTLIRGLDRRFLPRCRPWCRSLGTLVGDELVSAALVVFVLFFASVVLLFVFVVFDAALLDALAVLSFLRAIFRVF